MVWFIIIFAACVLTVIGLSWATSYTVSRMNEYLDYEFYSDDEGL
jgi:hypothetical protein